MGVPYHYNSDARGGSTILNTLRVRTAAASHWSPLELWHLLSLDAPTVATLWLVFAARAAHQRLPAALPPAMFCAVWMLYAADRLFDTLPGRAGLEPRHRFHNAHRTGFLAGLIAAAGVLSLLLAHMPLLHGYLLLGALLLGWFVAVHLPAEPASARLPKEVVTGIVFSAAVSMPELHAHPDAHALLGAALFAALCALNCLLIHAWEAPQPTHSWTRALIRHREPLLLLLAGAALLLTPVALAVGLAALGLFALDRAHRRFAPTTLRALADAALLTPLVVLPFMHA